MLRNLTAASCALSALLVTARAQDFQPLAPALQEFRSGGGGEISVRFSATAFRVLQLKESEISSKQGRILAAKDRSFPSIKITRTGMWMVHEVSRDLTVEEPLGKNGSRDSTRNWKAKVWRPIGTYERGQLQKFVEFALTNGLSGIDERRYGRRLDASLSFASATPASFSAGGRTIELNADFRQQMRFAPEYPMRGGDNGFVILLHDPHQSLSISDVIGIASADLYEFRNGVSLSGRGRVRRSVPGNPTQRARN
jgi:hypothetical protein